MSRSRRKPGQARCSTVGDHHRGHSGIALATVKQHKGHIDILFANAGGGEFPLRAITEEHFHKPFNSHVKGAFFTMQKALPLFDDGGSIILNASIVSMKRRQP